MQVDDELQEITEGRTRLLVPKSSLGELVPPRSPAFFNPNARLNRDLSILAYKAYVRRAGNRTMADALAGVGSRSVRAALEIEELERVYINDANPLAIDIARRSSALNAVEHRCGFSVNEACKFLVEHSSRGSRFGIVDLDPFGTPAQYVDCALRAVSDDGLLSLTATDTPVLCGIYPDVCERRYYGRSINTEYGNEVGIRLILGLVSMVASRLERGIEPLLVQSTRNYLRVYALVKAGSEHADAMPGKLGYIYHCVSCDARSYSNSRDDGKRRCDTCKKAMKSAGPLWIDGIFGAEFIESMEEALQDCTVDKRCRTLLSLARDEVNMPPTYFSVDRVFQKLRSAPAPMARIIEKLRNSGFIASRTSLRTTGFRTDARYYDVCEALRTPEA